MTRFEAKYFGIAFGGVSILLFVLTLMNIFILGNEQLYTKMIPFIPFMKNMSFFTIAGGIIVSFLWGFFLGYLLIVIYNFYHKKFSENHNN